MQHNNLSSISDLFHERAAATEKTLKLPTLRLVRRTTVDRRSSTRAVGP